LLHEYWQSSHVHWCLAGVEDEEDEEDEEEEEDFA
jgi:hypothetical protein